MAGRMLTVTRVCRTQDVDDQAAVFLKSMIFALGDNWAEVCYVCFCLSSNRNPVEYI